MSLFLVAIGKLLRRFSEDQSSKIKEHKKSTGIVRRLLYDMARIMSVRR